MRACPPYALLVCRDALALITGLTRLPADRYGAAISRQHTSVRQKPYEDPRPSIHRFSIKSWRNRRC